MKTITDILAPDQEEANDLTGQRAYLARRDYRMAHECMEEFERFRGAWAARVRRRHILNRKRKRHHGRLVFRMICAGCRKERWESEWLLWAVVDPKRYYCAWCHNNGAPVDTGQRSLFGGEE